MRNKSGIFLALLISGIVPSFGQTVSFTLQDVVAMAKEKSIAARQAATVKETRYWQYQKFRSNYKPQLSLNGVLPGYNKTFTQVVQPDGNIRFQPVYNNNSSLNLSFSQSLAATGGSVFGTTQLQRFDDFQQKFSLYNAVPFGVGYSQPLFQFNSLKWDRRIEPLKFKESEQQFIESMEQIAIQACGYYFDLLLAQVNLQIANSNVENTRTIRKIANEKFELGKISRNEILQLELEQVKAQKASGIARRDLEISTLNLKSFIGLSQSQTVTLQLPVSTIAMDIQTQKVLDEALLNRSDAIAFVRRMAEARRDVEKAKGDNGLNATLTAQIGFSNSQTTVSSVYQSPKDQQQVQLVFSVPILDWGRSKSRAKTAEANARFTAFAVEQDKQVFHQEIVTQVTLFDMMKDQLKLTSLADSIASEKHQIAKDRYVLGNLSITDLSIAFQEKDQAKRDSIAALRDFWLSYYKLRYLSLFDFEKGEKIQYQPQP